MGGIIPFSRDRTTFIRDAIPLAGSVCPMLVFTEPMRSGFPGILDERKNSPIARTSIGSPVGVPRSVYS